MSLLRRLLSRFFQSTEEIAAEAAILAEQHAARHPEPTAPAAKPYQRPYPFLPHNSSFVPPLPARRPEPVTNLPPTPPAGEGKDGSAQMPSAARPVVRQMGPLPVGPRTTYMEPTLKLTVALPAEYRSELVPLVDAIVGAYTGMVPPGVVQQTVSHVLAQLALPRKAGGCRSGRCGIRRRNTEQDGKK